MKRVPIAMFAGILVGSTDLALAQNVTPQRVDTERRLRRPGERAEKPVGSLDNETKAQIGRQTQRALGERIDGFDSGRTSKLYGRVNTRIRGRLETRLSGRIEASSASASADRGTDGTERAGVSMASPQ